MCIENIQLKRLLEEMEIRVYRRERINRRERMRRNGFYGKTNKLSERQMHLYGRYDSW